MDRPVPPQVIPRPANWRMGDAAPWAHLHRDERREITVARVLGALTAHGQRGPVPDNIGTERILESSRSLTHSGVPVETVIDAAVLAVLFEEEGEARLLFTRRSSSLRFHRGQVSFPGGRLDPGEDPPSAALREAFEEIALDPALITMEGWIHPVLTMESGLLVMPIVASVVGRPELVPSPAEVERVFDASLRDLADTANFHEELWNIPREDMPGGPEEWFTAWFFEVEGEMIWGATARMIHELLRIVLSAAR